MTTIRQKHPNLIYLYQSHTNMWGITGEATESQKKSIRYLGLANHPSQPFFQGGFCNTKEGAERSSWFLVEFWSADHDAILEFSWVVANMLGKTLELREPEYTKE